MYQIELFGTPLIYYDGQRLSIRRRASRALLCYLAALGKPIGRSRLWVLFWPDDSEKDARRHLRETLGKLRGSLPDPDLIQTYQETVFLDLERATVDVLTFHSLLEQAGRPSKTFSSAKPLSVAVYQALARAAETWRSPHFLSGQDLSFSSELETWQVLTNRDLESEMLLILNRLAEHDRRAGNLAQAKYWLDKSLEIDRLDESMHARLIKLLSDSGQQTEARKHYAFVEQLLADELGSEPSDEFLSLKARLYGESPREHANPEPTWSIRSSMPAPFLGQEQALAQLRHVQHNGGWVAVLGEAGIGKTRLVQEFYQSLERPSRLLLAACHPLESSLPFSPWIEALRHSLTPAEWAKIPTVWVSQLAVLLPELADQRNDLQSVQDVSPARARLNLFEALYQTFISLAEESPLLVFLDDAHWADESTLALIPYLNEHEFFAPERAMLITAARVEEPNPAFDNLLQMTARQPVQRLELSRLEQTDVAALAFYVLGEHPPLEFVSKLTQDTGGNPFFVLETLRAVLDLSPDLQLRKLTKLPLARSIHQLINARLQKLSNRALDLLQTAAVLGSRFKVDLLERASVYGPEQFTRLLEELEEARLILGIEEDDGLWYAFVHEKFRESLLLQLSPTRIRKLHYKVARTLEDWLNGQIAPQAAILAEHYEAAGVYSNAFDCWVEAASYAYSLASVQDANAAFLRAERLIARLPGLRNEQIYQLYSRWNYVGFENDDWLSLERRNQNLLRIGRERKNDLLIGTALIGLSDADFTANKFAEGLRYVEEAIPFLERSGNTFELLSAFNDRGVLLYMLGRMREAQEWFRTVLLRSSSLDFPYNLRISQDANFQMAISETLMGRPVSGLQYARKSLDEATRIQSAHSILGSYSVMGLANYLMGNFTVGREACLQGIELSERIEAWRMLGYSYAYCSLNELELGLLKDAWLHAERAMEIGIHKGHNEIVSLAYRAAGDIFLRLRAYDQAIELFQRGVEAGGDHYSSLDNLFRVGFAMVETNLEEGLAYIKRAFEKAAKLDLGSISIYAECINAILQLANQQDRPTRQDAEQLRARAEEHSMRFFVVLSDLMLAYLSFYREDYTETTELLSKVVEGGRSMSNPWIEIRAYVLMIRMSKLPGLSPDRSRAELESVLDKIGQASGIQSLDTLWQAYRQKLIASL
jgi:DNA-binding SARP family transcriptional activator